MLKRITLLLLMTVVMGVTAPGASAQGSGMDEATQRDELIRVLELRALAFERRVAEMREQAQALRDGADLETIQEQVQAMPAPEVERPVRRRAGEGAGPEGVPEGREQRRQGRDRVEVTPEMTQRVMRMLKEQRPDFAERLQRLKEERPEVFERVLSGIIEGIMGDDPEAAELELNLRATELELGELAQQVRDDLSKGPELEQDIRAALNKSAVARIAFERYRISSERDRLTKREEFLNRIIEKRSEFIEARLAMILEGKEMRRRGPRPEREQEPQGEQRRDRNPDDRPVRDRREP